MNLRFVLTVVTLGSLGSAAPVDPPELGCKDSPADIYFLLDCSSSVWIVDYDKQLDFVVSVVQKMHIHPNATRVGLGIFSDAFTPVIDIGGYPDEDTLIRAIRNTPYLSGNTYTGRGIHGMRTRGFRDSIQRPNVTKIGIVVTDGWSRHRSNTVAEATLARAEDIWLFAIGVGTSIDSKELSIIASEPKADFAFHVASFDILKTLVNTLAISPCQLQKPQADGAVCGQKRKADVMFVYNGASLSLQDTGKVRNFTSSVVGEFSMTSGNVRAGVISQSCSGGDIELAQYVKREAFVGALMNQPKAQLGPLLKKVRLQGYDLARGGRRDATKMAVVFVDDKLVSRDDVLYEALLMKYNDVMVYVIAVGTTYDLEEVKAMATSAAHVTRVASYDELLKDAERKAFLDQFCEHL